MKTIIYTLTAEEAVLEGLEQILKNNINQFNRIHKEELDRVILSPVPTPEVTPEPEVIPEPTKKKAATKKAKKKSAPTKDGTTAL